MDSMFQSPLMLLKSGSMPSIGSGYDEEIAPTFDTTKASAGKFCLYVAGAPAPCACRLASRRSAGVEELFKQPLGKGRDGLPIFVLLRMIPLIMASARGQGKS